MQLGSNLINSNAATFYHHECKVCSDTMGWLTLVIMKDCCEMVSCEMEGVGDVFMYEIVLGEFLYNFKALYCMQWVF